MSGERAEGIEGGLWSWSLSVILFSFKVSWFVSVDWGRLLGTGR